MAINNVIILGNITKDIELKQSQGGVAWTSFAVAVDNPGKDKGTSFIGCKAFGKTAELVNKHGAKGKRITVQGHIQTGNYVDKNGAKVYTTDVIVDRVEFAEWVKTEPDETDKQAQVPEGFAQLTEDYPF